MKILALIANLLVPSPEVGVHVRISNIDEHAPNFVVVENKQALMGIVVHSCPNRNWHLDTDLLLIQEGKTLYAVNRQRYQATWVMLDNNQQDTMNALEVAGELCRARIN